MLDLEKHCMLFLQVGLRLLLSPVSSTIISRTAWYMTKMHYEFAPSRNSFTVFSSMFPQSVNIFLVLDRLSLGLEPCLVFLKMQVLLVGNAIFNILVEVVDAQALLILLVFNPFKE
jgi:hypothetical protein